MNTYTQQNISIDNYWAFYNGRQTVICIASEISRSNLYSTICVFPPQVSISAHFVLLYYRKKFLIGSKLKERKKDFTISNNPLFEKIEKASF